MTVPRADHIYPRWFYWAVTAGFLVSFLLLSLVSTRYTVFSPVAVWYPPAGLVLALLLGFGIRYAPVVAVAALLEGGLLSPYAPSVWPSLLDACVAAGLYALAACLIHRVTTRDWHRWTIVDLRRFLFITAVATFLVALLSLLIFYSSGAVPANKFWVSVYAFWIGDYIGILSLTPCLMLVVVPRLQRSPTKHPVRINSGIVLLQIASILLVIWANLFAQPAEGLNFSFLFLIPLIWITLQHGFSGASLAVLVLNFGATAIALFHLSPLEIVALIILLITISLAGLFMGVLTSERLHSIQELSFERAYLDSALNVLPIPLAFRTTDSIIRANAAFTAYFGGIPTDAQLEKLKYFSADASHTLIPQSERPGDLASRGLPIQDQEYLIQLPEGREVPTLVNAAPIIVDGTLIASVVATQDLTRLKAADRAKNEFLMIISHELKTPATSILGWAQAALKYEDVRPQALQIIERNAIRQRDLLQKLLEVSRIISGQIVLQRAPADLWAITVDAVEAHAAFAHEHEVTVSLSPPDVPLPVNADAAYLQQLLETLLHNAVKFSPRGRVDISGFLEPLWAVIVIHDTGRGISPEDVATIFTPFRQVQREERNGGLGLGLTMAKGIAELHGGTISADSSGLHCGSTFTLRLPIAPSAARAEAA